jgi:hypothetical protein
VATARRRRTLRTSARAIGRPRCRCGWT